MHPALSITLRDATDLFNIDDKDHMLLVDYYRTDSGVEDFTRSTSTFVFHKIKSIFACFVIPEREASANDSQYACKYFDDFAQL